MEYVGLAASIVQFAELATKLTVAAYEAYKSESGSCIEDLHSASMAKSLEDAIDLISKKKAENSDEELGAIAEKCRETCHELNSLLSQLTLDPTISGGAKAISSLKLVIKSKIKRSDVERLEKRLAGYREVAMMRLQVASHTDVKDIKRHLMHVKETSTRNVLLEKLRFHSMGDREDSVQRADPDTFGWLADSDEPVTREWYHDEHVAARNRYLAWLQDESHMFHISGKAGSGKSTLLRLLGQHRHTRESLAKWAEPKTLVFASFYFWVASRDPMQTSLEGLYRTILYKVLSQCPDLALPLFPQCKNISQSALESMPMYHGDIENAFENLVHLADSHPWYRFCFFIDGLDEYRGDGKASGISKNSDPSFEFRQLAKYLLKWSWGGNVKICSSSRPYTEFLGPLQSAGASVIQLHLLNSNDIFFSCKKTFEGDEEFSLFKPHYMEFVHRITAEAEGVFLWATLVTRWVTICLARGDDLCDIRESLRKVPEELDYVYDQLLSLVNKEDVDRRNRIFLIMLNKVGYKEYLTPLAWTSKMHDPQFLRPYLPPSQLDLEKENLKARRQILHLTKGVVMGNEMRTGAAALTASFLHRSAFEYLQKRLESGQLPCGLDFEKDDIYGRMAACEYFFDLTPLKEIYLRDASTLDSLYDIYLSRTDEHDYASDSYKWQVALWSDGSHSGKLSRREFFFSWALGCGSPAANQWALDKFETNPELFSACNERFNLFAPVLWIRTEQYDPKLTEQIQRLLDMGARIHGPVELHNDISTSHLPAWMLVVAGILREIHSGALSSALSQRGVSFSVPQMMKWISTIDTFAPEVVQRRCSVVFVRQGDRIRGDRYLIKQCLGSLLEQLKRADKNDDFLVYPGLDFMTELRGIEIGDVCFGCFNVIGRQKRFCNLRNSSWAVRHVDSSSQSDELSLWAKLHRFLPLWAQPYPALEKVQFPNKWYALCLDVEYYNPFAFWVSFSKYTPEQQKVMEEEMRRKNRDGRDAKKKLEAHNQDPEFLDWFLSIEKTDRNK